MQHTKTHAQHLLRFQQMTDISPAVMLTCRTLTAFLDRPGIQFVFGIEQIQLPLIGIDMSVASVSAGIDTIKEINSPLHTFQNIRRSPHSHQISRFLFRKMRHYFVQNIIHLLMTLSYRKTAHCITIQFQLTDPLCMINSNIRVNCTLIDSKQ